MANERDRMTDDRNTDDSMRGGMGDREGGRGMGGDATDRPGDETSERIRGTGDDMEEDEFDEAEDLDEDEDEEESGTI